MFGLLAGLYMAANVNLHPRAMEIVEVDKANNIAICVDAVGMEWEFTEPDDLCEGDIVICMLDDKGTATLKDDEIVDVFWSGYTIRMFMPFEVRIVDI